MKRFEQIDLDEYSDAHRIQQVEINVQKGRRNDKYVKSSKRRRFEIYTGRQRGELGDAQRMTNGKHQEPMDE